MFKKSYFAHIDFLKENKWVFFMLRCLSCFIFSLLVCVLYGAENPFPPIISFDRLKTDAQQENVASGLLAFNRAPELRPFFEMLKQYYPITIVVETGTYQGRTTAFFAQAFEEVHTIEISPDFIAQAKEQLSSFCNIQFHLGSSNQVLAQILPTLKDRFILFYLDAHWRHYWPLLDELEEIYKTHRQHCIIVIDDIKVPGRPDIPYDAYQDHECSFDYVKSKVEKIFNNYSVHYLIPSALHKRAKLVILPL